MQMTLRDGGFTSEGQKHRKQAFSTSESKFLPNVWLLLWRCLPLPCLMMMASHAFGIKSKPLLWLPRPCPPHSPSSPSPLLNFCYTSLLCLDYPDLTIAPAPGSNLWGWMLLKVQSPVQMTEKYGLMGPLPCEAAPPS